MTVGLLWSSCVSALNSDLTLKDLHHTSWEWREGAPVAGIDALAQSRDGFIWVVASDGGLYRFDGIAFEPVMLPHDPKLSSVHVRTVYALREGGIWIGLLYGGVARFRDGRWNIYPVGDGVPPGSPRSFAEAPDGSLWMVASGGVATFDGARWAIVGPDRGVPAAEPYSLLIDGQGVVWICQSSGIVTLHPGEQRFRPYPLSGPRPRLLYESSAGTIWASVTVPARGHHSSSAKSVRNSEWWSADALEAIHQNPPPAATGNRPQSGYIVSGRDGALWLLTTEAGLYRIVHPDSAQFSKPVPYDKIADAFTDADGLTSRFGDDLALDREGNVWVATTEGLDRFSEPRLEAPARAARILKAIAANEGEGLNIGLAPADGSGGLWLSNGRSSVQRYAEGRLSRSIITDAVTSLFRADDGSVWFGGSHGIWRERQGRLERFASPAPNRYTQALAVDKAGGLWASFFRSGVYYFKDGRWTPYGRVSQLPRGPAILIVRDHQDRMWFSYPEGKVFALDNGHVRAYGAADGLTIGNVTAIQADRNEIWFGAELGLARFDGERFHRVLTTPEVSLEGITGIVEMHNGDLWLNAAAGIVHLTFAQLQRSERRPSYRIRGDTLDASDGLLGNAAVVRPLPTAVQAGDGKLWFAREDRFYGVDPRMSVRNLVPPPVWMRALTFGDRTVDPIPGLRLPAYTTAVRFNYVALSFTAPEKVRYRYRLDGVDHDWRDITSARQALYTNLRPGRYTFRVIASNNDGVWNDTGAALSFVIPPAFVQTGWFIALCVAAGALAIWALVRLWVRQATHEVRGRLEERMAERERIARDLHDTLLQGVQGLVLRFQGVAKRIPHPDPAHELMERALERADRLLLESRDRVKNLRGAIDHAADLPTVLAAEGEQLSATYGPRFRLTIEGTPRPLHPIARDEVLLIGREALTNAFRHAQAQAIEAELSYGDKALTLRVRDDGRGLDTEVLRSDGRNGHWGLIGMRERAKRIRGHLQFWSKTGEGTELELRLAGQTAYRPKIARAGHRWSRRKSALIQEL